MRTPSEAVDVPGPRGNRRLGWLLALLLLGLSTGLFLQGADFYLLPMAKRVVHEDYRTLSPSGLVGHGYGFAGTALILTNLLYLVRRRLAHWPLGSLRVWLDVHMITGLVGGFLILFHSAFQLRSAIASTTSIALLAVILTGLVGRYLVSLAPRVSAEAWDAVMLPLQELAPSVSDRVQGILHETKPEPSTMLRSTFGSARVFVVGLFAAGRRKRIVQKTCRPEPHETVLVDKRELQKLARSIGRLAEKEIRAESVTSLLKSWRRLHRFFALLMLTTVCVHIGVAWHFGYRWIF